MSIITDYRVFDFLEKFIVLYGSFCDFVAKEFLINLHCNTNLRESEYKHFLFTFYGIVGMSTQYKKDYTSNGELVWARPFLLDRPLWEVVVTCNSNQLAEVWVEHFRDNDKLKLCDTFSTRLIHLAEMPSIHQSYVD